MGLTTGNSVVLTGLAIELDVANPKSYAVFGGVKGYSLGGYTGAASTTADKITYSTDTTAAQTSANLSLVRSEIRGLSEGNTKGYTCGGYSSARITTTDITFFASDVTTTINSATLSLARNDYAGLSTYVNKGYIAGGATNSAYTNSIEFLYYSNSTSAAQTTVTLSVTRGSIGSISQPNIQGYLAGGATSSVTFYATTDKLVYSTDSCAAQTTANLSTVRQQAAGISECQTKGFWAGGFSSSAAILATVDKITFSTDTTVAQTTSNISTSRSAASSPTQGSSKGYVLGGYTSWAGAVSIVSDRILFATETMAAQTSANLSVARGYGSSLDNIYAQTISDISGNVNAGTINNFTTYSRDNSGCLIFSGSVDYPNTATVAANSSYAFGTGDFTYEVWFNAASFASSNNYILDLGSNAGNLQYYAGKLSYYNTTIGGSANLATKGPNLIPGNWYHAVITRISGTTYMYINGNLITSNADTHNYSAPAVTIGNYGGGGKYGWNGKIALFRLYSSKGLSATEVLQNYNAAKNRFLVPSPVIDTSLVLNLDASNRLSFARYGGSKAYFSGGYDGASNNKTDKLVYSTDTTSALTSANTPTGHWSGSGLSDGYSKGYICGGFTTVSTTDKLTYSTESCVAATTANLSSGRGYSSRISNYSTKGFVMGGWTGASVATTDRVTYATDVTAAVTSASQPYAVHNSAGQITDGIAFGYDLGGYSSSPVNTSRKLTFSTEVTINMPNTLTSQTRWNPAGVSTFAGKGYISGGTTGGGVTVVTADKFSFATETMNSQSSANLSLAREACIGVSDGSTKGYMAGGATSGSGSTSTTDKITYNNDSTAAQSSANLSGNRYGMGGLDEIYAVSSTSWFDTTTNNNTSTLTNGPTYDLVQPAIIFDGTNDYVENSSPNLGITGNATATFSCWFYYSGTSSSTFNALFGYGNGSNSGDTFALGLNPSGTYRVSFEFNGGNSVQSYDNAYIPNSWNYFVGTKTPGAANTTTKLYINGVPLSIASATLITPNVSSRVIRAGRWINDGSPNYFTGKIAYCSIYNRELNISEILQNYSYYVNRLAIAAIGSSRDYPAPSGVAIKQVNPYAQTGYYWLSVGGTTSQYWIDMDYDGGGWVLVINNVRNTSGMSNLTYANATSFNVNTKNNFGSDYTPANFNCFVGLPAWKAIADSVAGANTVVMFVATAYRTLGNIANHTKRARFTWTGWSATYAWQGAAGYTQEAGSGTAGLWSYHITNGYSLTTFDQDQDPYGSNCSTLYNNNPWWYGACWDGNFLAGGAGYQDAPYWSGSGGDYHNYGAIYVR
jgi:hypothetical protein